MVITADQGGKPMERDFIADLLYYLFYEDKMANPMPSGMKVKLFEIIGAVLRGRADGTETQKKERNNG